MFEQRQRRPDRRQGAKDGGSDPVAQAMWRPARLLRSSRLYKEGRKRSRNVGKYKDFSAGERILIDDEGVLRETWTKEGTTSKWMKGPVTVPEDEDAAYDDWYEALTDKTPDRLFVKDGTFEFIEPSGSFQGLMRFLALVRLNDQEGRIGNRRSIMESDDEEEICSDLRSLYHGSTVRKAKGQDAETYASELSRLIAGRVPESAMTFGVQKSPTLSKEVRDMPDAHERLKGALHFFPPVARRKAERVTSQGVEMSGVGATKGATISSDTSFFYRVYVNVEAPYVHEVLPVVFSLIDHPGSTGRYGVVDVSLSPYRSIHKVSEPLIIYVQGEEGLQSVKLAMSTLAKDRPEYFADEIPAMTEPFGKGLSWGQESVSMDTEEMGDRVAGSVKRYLGRVKGLLDQPKGWAGRLWNFRKWDELATLCFKTQEQIQRQGGVCYGLNKRELLRMNELSGKLANEWMSDYVEEWLRKGASATRKNASFRDTRLEAISHSLTGLNFTDDQQTARAMSSFKASGIDFFNPHLPLASQHSGTEDWEFWDAVKHDESTMSKETAEEATDFKVVFGVAHGEELGLRKSEAKAKLLAELAKKKEEETRKGASGGTYAEGFTDPLGAVEWVTTEAPTPAVPIPVKEEEHQDLPPQTGGSLSNSEGKESKRSESPEPIVGSQSSYTSDLFPL
ncbi:hypothetical protein FUAX_04070 [Fulvitalea axinellae]|uniref:Uncharacterized protein n=1 Tax=Fulvitalea axinellae TaxID=1182444 RepID=A0AAU9DAU7_9BACT|nr:hypothetical protein FUAX_04070 [Fulvitalea axinellae]